MTRGDILVVLGRSGAVTKARPCVVVQRSSTLAARSKITACPMSSTIVPDTIFRPILVPTAENGLRVTSQVEVDWIFTEEAARFGPVIGKVDAANLTQIDESLRRWLDH